MRPHEGTYDDDMQLTENECREDDAVHEENAHDEGLGRTAA